MFLLKPEQIAAVHLYQPTFNGPRILLHYRRPAPCSWEMLDWVFFEGSTTATVVAFVYFWCVWLKLLLMN